MGGSRCAFVLREQTGGQFWVDVKGLSNKTAFLIRPKPLRLNLYYILVGVGETRTDDRFL
jgi:hypothetical protein